MHTLLKSSIKLDLVKVLNSVFFFNSNIHCSLLGQVIPGKEQRSIEALCWVGERLFSVGLSGEIIEFDLHNLRPRFTIDAYGGPIWTITANPQGTHLAVRVYLYMWTWVCLSGLHLSIF